MAKTALLNKIKIFLVSKIKMKSNKFYAFWILLYLFNFLNIENWQVKVYFGCYLRYFQKCLNKDF